MYKNNTGIKVPNLRKKICLGYGNTCTRGVFEILRALNLYVKSQSIQAIMTTSLF